MCLILCISQSISQPIHCCGFFRRSTLGLMFCTHPVSSFPSLHHVIQFPPSYQRFLWQERDPAVVAMAEVTEEGKKVARMGGQKYWAVFRQVLDSSPTFPRLQFFMRRLLFWSVSPLVVVCYFSLSFGVPVRFCAVHGRVAAYFMDDEMMPRDDNTSRR